MGSQPISLKVTAREAAQAAQAHQRQMNAGRRIDKLPAILEQLSEERKLYIYNCGPWPHMRSLGSLGSFYIPPCEEGKEFSAALVIPGIVAEPYPVNETQMALHQEEGTYIAEQIVGLGKHLPPSNSLVKYGVFISATEKPSKEDLAKAHRALRGHFRQLVNEANTAWSKGPKAAEETISPDLHFLAARRLNLTEAECPWLKNASTSAARENCAGCGTPYSVGIVLCPQCRFILDPEKYAKLKDRFQS